jgi:hypothetical protein
MGKKILLVVIILLGLIRVPVFSQVTTMGTDFYVSFGSNRVRSASATIDANGKTVAPVDLQIRVVATKATKVTYTFTHNGSQETRNIAAGEVNTFVLTEAQRKLVYVNSLNITTPSMSYDSKLSLHIESTEPVSVYALNSLVYFTDATNLLPVNVLGTDYYHISYAPTNNDEDKKIGATYDGYTIVATEENTTVSVNGTVLNTTPLTKGQVYHVYKWNTDMTGAHITSNHPIALFSNNVCSRVPNDKNASDYLFQQMMPVNTWGKKYVVPATIRGKERVRIVASQDNTTITQTGGTLKTGSLTLDKGQFVELETTLAAGGCYISADKPVGVCSYLVGYFDTAEKDPYMDGDPAIGWIPPVEQFVDSATIAPFIPGGTTMLNAHYALLVAKTNSIGETSMKIGTDAATALSGGTWTTGANPDYSFYNLPLTNTNHSYTFVNPKGLAILGYGTGSMEGYYYLAASAVRDLSAAFYVDGEHYSGVDGKKYHGVSDFHLKAVLEYVNETPGSIEWYIDGQLRNDATDKIEWDLTGLSPGSHTIKMRVRDLHNVFYSYEVTIYIYSLKMPVNPPRIRLIK